MFDVVKRVAQGAAQGGWRAAKCIESAAPSRPRWLRVKALPACFVVKCSISVSLSLPYSLRWSLIKPNAAFTSFGWVAGSVSSSAHLRDTQGGSQQAFRVYSCVGWRRACEAQRQVAAGDVGPHFVWRQPTGFMTIYMDLAIKPKPKPSGGNCLNHTGVSTVTPTSTPHTPTIRVIKCFGNYLGGVAFAVDFDV